MYMFVPSVSAGSQQMPMGQLEHLNAIWTLAADLHHASGHLLLLYNTVLCMSIKSSVTRGAAYRVSAHKHVKSSKLVLVY